MSSSASRCLQATEAQLVALVDYMEEDPLLARGHLKTACARRKMNEFWERVVPRLNSLGGATKSKAQWMKYWSDKKSAIKKKAAERAAARRRTGGGVENVRKITPTEERVVILLGGEGFAVGDRHLRYDVIHHSSEATVTVTSPTSPSVLLAPNMNSRQETPAAENLPFTTAYYGFDPVSPEISAHEGENRDTLSQNSQSPHQPGPELAPSPPTRLPCPHVSANLRREGPSRQPPSQRRSQITSISERFLRIEERRLALEERIAESNFITAQAQRDMAAALRCLGDGNRAIADAVRDGFKSMKEK